MSTERATCWSVTINNPSADDEENIALARQKGWKVEGQLEKGKEGTPHYQLMVKTPQVRFSAMKKAFPRAHIEVARNAAALVKYVHKEEGREGELPTNQDKYPSLSKLWHLVMEQAIALNWLDFTEGEPCGLWKDCPHRSTLDWLDDIAGRLIERGFHVETLVVNPQTRAAFAKFWLPIMKRAFADSQTDRHRVEDEQEVSVPMINADDSPPHHDSPPSPSDAPAP